jgi:hypothetical protein
MKQRNLISGARRKLGLLGCGALLFGCPFGGCQIDQVTASTTLDGREVLISLIRGAILSPIDSAITYGVNEFFDEFVDEED